MADLIFNDIKLHKPLPITTVVLYAKDGLGGWDKHTLENILTESNIVAEPLLAKDGYGGDRAVGLIWKLILYYNRFDVTIDGQITRRHAWDIVQSEAGRLPMKVKLGDTARVQNCGTQWLSFVTPVNYLTLAPGYGTANKFFRTQLTFKGLLRYDQNIFGDASPT